MAYSEGGFKRVVIHTDTPAAESPSANFQLQERKNIRRFGDPVLLAQLMPDVSKYRPDIKFWIIFVVIGLFSVLLARPQFGSKQETVKRKG